MATDSILQLSMLKALLSKDPAISACVDRVVKCMDSVPRGLAVFFFPLTIL